MSVLTKILVALIVTVSVPASAVAGHHGQNKDIVDVASANGSFKTLVVAVKAAGLVKTLKSKGPFTVFAPTDAAFAALPKGTIASLLKPENKGKLVAILTHHVLSGKVPAKAVLGKKLNPKTQILKFSFQTITLVRRIFIYILFIPDRTYSCTVQ